MRSSPAPNPESGTLNGGWSVQVQLRLDLIPMPLIHLRMGRAAVTGNVPAVHPGEDRPHLEVWLVPFPFPVGRGEAEPARLHRGGDAALHLRARTRPVGGHLWLLPRCELGYGRKTFHWDSRTMTQPRVMQRSGHAASPGL